MCWQRLCDNVRNLLVRSALQVHLIQQEVLLGAVAKYNHSGRLHRSQYEAIEESCSIRQRR